MPFAQHRALELSSASIITLVGIAMSTWAVLAHASLLVAPGALVITVGSAWLGNAMARHGVRLSATPTASESEGAQ